MTESEWLTCVSPQPMLEFLRGKVSDRKLRMFCFASIRRQWGQIPDARLSRAVEVSELHADGLASDAELGAAVREANRGRGRGGHMARAAYDIARYHPGRVEVFAVYTYLSDSAAWRAVPDTPPTAIGYFADGVFIHLDIPMNPERLAWIGVRDAELAAQADLLREAVGNPFQVVPDDPAWLDKNVRLLARQIYDGRSFERMPELGAMLLAAGCQNSEVVRHCCDKANHVRGCWALDRVLGLV